MKEYEVMIEEINPCGGSAHSRKSFIEVETNDPVAWVKANAQFPLMDCMEDKNGDTVIITGNDAGYRTTYVFTE